jgi:hypothetical protein
MSTRSLGQNGTIIFYNKYTCDQCGKKYQGILSSLVPIFRTHMKSHGVILSKKQVENLLLNPPEGSEYGKIKHNDLMSRRDQDLSQFPRSS